MKIKSSLLVLGSLMGLVACSSLSTAPTLSRVELAADRTTYESGQPIVANLSNDAARAISFSWCDLGLERLEIEGWAAMTLPPRACILVMNVLRPGHQESLLLAQELSLPPATYRLLLSVRDNAEVEIVRSEPFEVTAD